MKKTKGETTYQILDMVGYISEMLLAKTSRTENRCTYVIRKSFISLVCNGISAKISHASSWEVA